MKQAAVLLICILFLAACREADVPVEAIPTHAPEQQRSTPWQEDLDLLTDKVVATHFKTFDQDLKAAFLERAKALREELPAMDEARSTIGLMRLAASVGDAHTVIYPLWSNVYLNFYLWFKEGIFLLNTPQEMQDHLGKKLIAVDGKPIEAVVEKLAEVIPHENEQWLKAQVEKSLRNAKLLYDLSIAEKPDEVTLSFEDESGGISHVTMKAITFDQAESLPKKKLISRSGDYPLNYYQKNSFYWYRYLEEQQLVYIQYNKCQDNPEQSVEAFIAEIKNTIEKNQIDKVVVDLRNNSGGNSILIRPLMNVFAANKLDQSDRLFVLIGKNTFSSGMLNAIEFRRLNHATLVGEPSGGKPNHYGETSPLQLPHSKLAGNYSTKYFTKDKDADNPSLQPDLEVKLSIRDYLEGRDPCMDAILGANNSISYKAMSPQ